MVAAVVSDTSYTGASGRLADRRLGADGGERTDVSTDIPKTFTRRLAPRLSEDPRERRDERKQENRFAADPS